MAVGIGVDSLWVSLAQFYRIGSRSALAKWTLTDRET